MTADWAICVSDNCTGTNFKCCDATPPNGGTPSKQCVDGSLGSKVIPAGQTNAGYTYTCSTATTTTDKPAGARSLGATAAVGVAVMTYIML